MPGVTAWRTSSTPWPSDRTLSSTSRRCRSSSRQWRLRCSRPKAAFRSTTTSAKYVQQVPDFGKTITLRHLVHHTSGIRDWPGALGMGGWNYQDVISFNQIVRMAYHQRDLNFAPGAEYTYSNTGYNLLAEVVARVSGKSFREFCDERIFQPLGMKNTHFHDDHTEVVVNSADSYRLGPDKKFHRAVSNLTALGSSSLFTTVDDLAKWIDNFHSPKPLVGGSAVIARLHERGRLNDGTTIAYAFGQSVGEYRGLRTVTHTRIVGRLPQRAAAFSRSAFCGGDPGEHRGNESERHCRADQRRLSGQPARSGACGCARRAGARHDHRHGLEATHARGSSGVRRRVPQRRAPDIVRTRRRG